MVDEIRCTSTALADLLDERGVLVADGAMGTTLFANGLEGGGCPELLNLERPDMIRKVHLQFLEAGADIILTNTFGGNRRRLALHGLSERVAELNAAAVEVARGAASTFGRSVVVAGSVGPTGDLLEPLGPLSQAEAVDVFTEQAAALGRAGADVLWIETLSSIEELEAAAAACAGFELPVVATLSFDTNGHTMMGVHPRRLAEWWQASGRGILGIGANCGIGPGDAVASALDISACAPGVVVVTKPNCGMPLYETDRLVYPVGPERMDDYVELAVRSGARIVGACCGSTPDHIAAIRSAVDEVEPGDRPDRTEIEERLDASPVRSPTAEARSRRRSRR